MAAAERLRHAGSGAHGGLFVSGLQRARLLDATFAVVAEQGYRGMAVRAVAERAGVSSKTFYDLFSDREDCFLAAFDHGVEQLAACARPMFEGERDWLASIRAGLGVLLGFLDGEPALQRLVFVEALAAGPRVLERRAQLLGELSDVVEGGQAGQGAQGRLPGLIAEGVVGAAFGVIHARLLEQPAEPLVGLLGELMAVIVLPYRGRAAAARELTRPAPRLPVVGGLDATGDGSRGVSVRPLGSGPAVDFRLTVRTQKVLAVVAEHPGLSNHRVSELAGVSDQGQISRLMMRLSEQGLVENIGGQGQGTPKAWRLTSDGEQVIQTDRSTVKPADQAGPGSLRLTALTYKVLAATDELTQQGIAPGNRDLADAAGIRTAGQTSKLLARLQTHGLLENTGGPGNGPNAWQLTRRGEEIVHASQAKGQTV